LRTHCFGCHRPAVRGGIRPPGHFLAQAMTRGSIEQAPTFGK
jgi:hypothetical protein